MTESRHPELEQCALYALGALAPEVQARFESHLAGCSICRAELEHHRFALSVSIDGDHPVPAAMLSTSPANTGRAGLFNALRERRRARRQEAPIVLVTECMQYELLDAIPPVRPTPMRLAAEVRSRFLGHNPSGDGGALGNLLERFLSRGRGGSRHRLLHVRDVHHDGHEGTEEHFEALGVHCMEGTRGAEFVPVIEETLSWERTFTCTIDDLEARDGPATLLDTVATNFDLREVRVGIVGAFTDHNVPEHALAWGARLGAQIAVCAPLTAASTEDRHARSLDQLAASGVEILPDVSTFARWLDLG